MKMNVDLDLVRKYNRPGPRYTSYPTAPHFSSDITRTDWEKQIKLNNSAADRDLSLYFHIPFCDTLCWFCGCTTIVTRKPESIEEYLAVLYQEIDLVRGKLNPDRKVTQMHYGGGTPTYLTPAQLRQLGSKIHDAFKFDPKAEISCEMDPRELTHDHIIALRETGFNRVSLGVQDFDPGVQNAINRINPLEMIQEVVSWIRTEEFQSLNLDLIYGLPHQTSKSFNKTLDEILAFDPDRLAVFNYAHVPWMKPHQKLINEADLPTPEEKLDMLKLIIEKLTSSGYAYIGMDHFAKEDNELTIAQQEKSLQRNFQGYSTKLGTDIYAMGMSSISQVGDAYLQNYKDLPDYYRLIRQGQLPVEKGYILTEDDKIRRDTIMRLMCDLELDFTAMSKRLGIDFSDYFKNELDEIKLFETDELLIREAGKITVTEKGRMFVRNIAMEFDAHLPKDKARYSRTI